MKKFRKGQGTLEYVIILAAVVGAIIAVAAMLRQKIPTSYDELSTNMSNKIGQVDFNK